MICHVEPDGDAVGSMLGLAEALRSKNKKVRTVCKDRIPAIFSYLGNTDLIGNTFSGEGLEAIILLDNGDFRRTGFTEEIRAAQGEGITVLNIDHHPKNDLWKIANINYANEEASSASEIVYNILVGLDYEISPAIATSLLTGIFYDTGGFKHPNTSEQVLGVAADLLCRGARLRKISDNIANSKSVSVFRLWGIALSRLRIHPKLGISVSVLCQKDLEACGASEDDVSGLVNLLSSAPESKVALLLYETKDAKIKGSLRTERDNIDLAKLAQLLGGGGHKKASGFTLPGRVEIEGDRWRVV